MRFAVLAGAIACVVVGNVVAEAPRVRVGFRTMADLRAIATALDSYAVDHGAFPVIDRSSADVLRSILSQEYIGAFDSTDEWERPLYVISSGISLAVWSNGRDGKEDGAPKGGSQENPDRDIIFEQRMDGVGSFWQAPALAAVVGDGPSCTPNPVTRVESELRVLDRLGVRVAP